MYEEDLALNNLEQLICHKTKPNLTGTTTGSIGNERVLYTSRLSYRIDITMTVFEHEWLCY